MLREPILPLFLAALLLLLLLPSLGADVLAQDQDQSGEADIYTDKGGRGEDRDCGTYRPGENVTIYVRVSRTYYDTKIVLLNPRLNWQNFTIREFRKNYVIIYRGRVDPNKPIKVETYFVENGTYRLVFYVRGYLPGFPSGARLYVWKDWCYLKIARSTVSGDVFTDEGGRGDSFTCGVFDVGDTVKVKIKVNLTTNVELRAIHSDGKEKTLFKGQLKGGVEKSVDLELERPGKITLKLFAEGRAIDTCRLEARVKQTPAPKLVLEEPLVEGMRVTLSGRAEPGSSDMNLKIEVDWGDGSVENVSLPASHTYATPGIYDLKVRVIQEDGQVVTEALKVEVSGQQPKTLPITTGTQPVATGTAPTSALVESTTTVITTVIEESPAGSWVLPLTIATVAVAGLLALVLLRSKRG